jgi:CBS domain-containing protein
MQVRQIMTDNPACVIPDDTIERAAHLMEECDCGCIPVVQARDNNTVVGVITDRDIAVRGVGHGRSPTTSVRELMTDGACCCSSDASVQEVETLMSERQIRRVVIVDDGGYCVGIVAQADLARAAEGSPEVSDQEIGRLVERISEPPSQNWRP